MNSKYKKQKKNIKIKTRDGLIVELKPIPHEDFVKYFREDYRLVNIYRKNPNQIWYTYEYWSEEYGLRDTGYVETDGQKEEIEYEIDTNVTERKYTHRRKVATRVTNATWVVLRDETKDNLGILFTLKRIEDLTLRRCAK